MKDDAIRWGHVLLVAGTGVALLLSLLLVQDYLYLPGELVIIGIAVLAGGPLLLGLLYSMIRDAIRHLSRLRNRRNRKSVPQASTRDFAELCRRRMETADQDLLKEAGLTHIPLIEDISYEAEKEKWQQAEAPVQRTRLTISRLRLALTTIPFLVATICFGYGLFATLRYEDLAKVVYSLPNATTDAPFLVLIKTGFFVLGGLGSLYMAAILVLTQITYPSSLFGKNGRFHMSRR